MGALPPPVEHPDDTVQTVHFVASGSLAVATWKNSVRAYEYIIAS